MKMEKVVSHKAMFHTDCPKNHFGGIMKPTSEIKEHANGTGMRRYDCLHCGESGWYGVHPETRLIHVEAMNGANEE